ncbi:MAG TPA: beta-N-acetylhexosaminidase [Actinomycetes bacterium]|nr:beta-N-acetylhexosaminidase [Actinomycetes bacterium]
MTAPRVVPVPVSTIPMPGQSFTLGHGARIVVAPGANEGLRVARQLAAILRPSTGYPLPVLTGRGAAAAPGDIVLSLASDAALGREGYRLAVTPDGIQIRAVAPAGLFYGVQTLRQLLSPWIESTKVQAGPWTVPAVHITDHPRYTYRGVMLDIARHFEPPAAVKRLIDDASALKINVLHLHVSDDQGFRIAINGRPELTDIGSQFSVGNDPGGYWTQADYIDVVRYAAAHYMTVIPEVDTPGHNNAIIMSYNTGPTPPYPVYADINCGANKPPVWDLTFDVGYSALCPDSDNTWAIPTDIIGQLTAMSPGPYYHLGGDEVPASLLTADQYNAFIDRESQIIEARGKIVMGWADISSAGFDQPGAPQAVAQFWNNGNPAGPGGDTARIAVQKGMQVVMSPANHTYLDMQQFRGSPLGLSWAGILDVSDFYNWSGSTSDPGTYIPARTSDGVTLPAVTDANIIGVEAPIWSETLRTIQNIEFQAFPRLAATAEIGWSPRYDPVAAPEGTLSSFEARLAARGAAWQIRDQNFYASTQVPWRVDVAAPNRIHGDRAFSGAVASVAAPGATLAGLTTTIDWGDGTSSPGTLTGAEATSTTINSLYTASGSHTYAAPGVYHAKITVSRPGSSAAATFTVVAAGASS